VRLVALISLCLALSCLLCPGVLHASEATLEAKALLAEGRRDRAKVLLLEEAKRDPRDAEVCFLLAKVYTAEQDFDLAAEYAEKSIKLADSVSLYHLNLARILLGKTTQSGALGAFMSARKGKKQYERAIELDPNNLDARFELCMYYLVAPGLIGGDKKKANEQAAALAARNDLYGSYAWASIYERDQDLARAESLYQRAVGLDTSSTAAALYGLAYFYERNKKYDDAIGVFKQISDNRPEDLAAVFQLGRAYLVAGTNLEGAEAAFTRYLAEGPAPNGPDEAAARWRLGMVYDLEGRRDEALAQLRKAVELAPKSKQYKSTLEEVEKKPKP